jgi:hypothetical protein
VVNLSAFETFFQERRPFFIEGSGVYNFSLNCSIVTCGGEGLFYSRRIGRSPQLFGLYADAASPNVSPIIGAAKLTGRPPGGLNVGVLEAVTDASGVTHYSFAHLDQETRSLGVRVSYTATPTLSFQLYAAPFVSRGQYTNTRELSANPRAVAYADRFAPYMAPAGTSLGFDVLQVRSNSVVRWEFRPGSTLFAVWTHGREGYDPTFRDRGWHAEYKALFALHPSNTFLLKLAYWLN